MANLHEYECPACGGMLNFDSGTQRMKCPFCETEIDVSALASCDDELAQSQPEDMSWASDAGGEWQSGETDGMTVFSCRSCGAQIVADKTLGATNCPYCDNPVVMMGRFSGELRPDLIIPFKLDKEAAKAGLKKHLKGKRLLPKAFKDQNHIDEIRGIYVPFWLFNATADANIRYKATSTKTWSDSNNEYTETQTFNIWRSGTLAFERVPVDCSTKMPDDLMESIEPFDASGLVPFQTAYLSGFLADKYDVTTEQSIPRANERIKSSTEEAFRATVRGYDSVTTASCKIRLKDASTQYALYPVWVLNTTYKGKQYLFAMNGQTGKFVGDLPLDKGAFWKWFLILTAIFGAAAYAVRWLIELL